MGKGKVAVKILLFYNLSEVKGPKRAGQDYDQMNIYPVNFLASQSEAYRSYLSVKIYCI